MSKKKKKKTPKQRKGARKTAKKVSAKKSWKKFEELVARMEKALAPKGAIVTSPDYLIDKTSDQKREVDASIRYKIGTTEIIITVECRERVQIQDSMWIEQLITKQQSIGSSKTIAVSINGFTEPAIKKAKLFGIELRKVTNVGEDDINKWLLTRTQINWKIVDWSINLNVDKDIGEKILQEIKTTFTLKGNPNFLFLHKTDKAFSVRNLFKGYLEQTRGKTGEIVFSEQGISGIFKLDAKIAIGQIYIKTSMGNFDLMGLKTDYLFYKHEEITVKPTANYIYSDTSTDLVEGIEFEIVSGAKEKELFTMHKNLIEDTTVTSVWKDMEAEEAPKKSKG